MVAEEPQLIIGRDAEGRWHGPFDRAASVPHEEREGDFALTWLLPDVQVAGGTVLWIDEYERAVPREVRVTDVNAVIDSDLLRTEADVSLTGAVDGDRLFLSGSLSLLNSAPSVGFEGSLELERFDMAPWLDAAQGSAPPSEDPWRVDVTTQLVIMPGRAGHDVTLSRLEARLPWWTIRSQDVIQSLGAAPLYSATLSELDGEVGIDGMPVRQLISGFNPDADRLRGLLSMAGGLRATLHPATPVVSTLHSRGPLHLRVTDGRVLHGTVLPKVLKLLNVPALLQGQVEVDPNVKTKLWSV